MHEASQFCLRDHACSADILPVAQNIEGLLAYLGTLEVVQPGRAILPETHQFVIEDKYHESLGLAA